MKLLHTADIHFSREHQAEALASLMVLAETAERERPALVAISGDLFDRGLVNSTASGFPALLAVIQRILEVCPIAAVSGTPSHDAPGCYDALTKLRAKHPFILLDPTNMSPVAFICTNGKIEVEIESAESPVSGKNGEAQLMILGCPEPTREWLLAGKEAASAEETSAALKTGLRSILLGLGAIRAQYPDLPAVMLYHGPVEGASMQNGQVIGAGSITIGREDLALVGADYYALGDIHLAQQVGDLPAYYPGSAYPVNWGELGQSGFNLVEIAKGIPFDSNPAFEAIVTRIDYPHPRRKKIVWTLNDHIDLKELNGFQTWVVLKGTKEQLATVEPNTWSDILSSEALPGSRMTTELIPTETVRAAEIVEKRTLREKIIVKAEADSEPAPAESVLLKADALEHEAEKQGYGGATHHLRLREARIRGHIAHHKRLGVDEVRLDLKKYGPGLISLVSPNGTGKTALGENCHWFPCEWSPGRDRKGGLKDNFCLRDSAREVWKDDPRTGEEYRSLMEIDGANASGKVECHLFYKAPGSDKWDPFAGGKGKMAEYIEGVQKLEGTPTMFLRSAFWTQEPSDNNPRIRRATKGQKKEVFAEFAGLDHFKVYAKSAKDRADRIESEISVERGRINLIESQLTALPGIIEQREEKASELDEKQDALSALEQLGKQAKANVDALADEVSEQRSIEERIAGLNEQIAQKQQTVLLAQENIESYQQAIEQRPLAEKVIITFDQLKEQENAENRRLSAINTDHARLQGEYNDRLKAHHADVRAVESKQSGLRTESARLAGDRNVLQAKIQHLAEDLKTPLKENCPTCGQVLPAPKLTELKKKRAKAESEREELKEKHSAKGQEIAAIDEQLAAIILPPDLPPLVLPPVDQAPLRRIQGALAVLQIDEARKTLATAQEAATRIEETRKRMEDAAREIVLLQDQVHSAESQLDPFIQESYEDAQKKLEEARKEYGEAQKVIAAIEAQIQSMDARISELRAMEKGLGERRAKLEQQQIEATEWRYLEAACGPDGIPALELDALGPGIAAEANKLLDVVKDRGLENFHYDQIKFETTRISGKGSKTHQIEDFTILCHDIKHADWVDFALISVGEAVWVDTALMDAFAIIRDKNSGKRSLTQWRDESDAALDPQSRRAYFEMLQAAHDASGRYQTIITTHSPEAQEMIAQKIDLQDLVVREQTGVLA